MAVARAPWIGPGLKLGDIVGLLAPLLIGGALAVLLIRQSLHAQAAQDAFAASEERFRLAVEAARCGIWEWDLVQDKVFMSDVTGMILGWGGGGVASGEEVLNRISAEHREPVRQALLDGGARRRLRRLLPGAGPAGAARPGSTPAARATASRKAARSARIIGVAFDVTDERLAQARAEAAEDRLRDAIESVSEAFVLWDRYGRLLMCNRAYATVFSLDPRLLKVGALREGVERFAQLAIKQTHPAPSGRQGRARGRTARRPLDAGLRAPHGRGRHGDHRRRHHRGEAEGGRLSSAPSTAWSAARTSWPNWPASTRSRRSAPRAPTRPRASSWPT